MNTNATSTENKTWTLFGEYIEATRSMTNPQAAVLTVGLAGLTLISLKTLDVIGQAIEKGAALTFNPCTKTWSLQSSAS